MGVPRSREDEERSQSESEKIMERAYRTARLPGAPPRGWLKKSGRLIEARKLPKELEHLYGPSPARFAEFLKGLDEAARNYWRAERREERQLAGRMGQAAAARKGGGFVTASRTRAGRESGNSRREARESHMSEIVHRYRFAYGLSSGTKVRSLVVARWWVETQSAGQNVDSLSRRLKRSGVAV